MIVEIQTWYGMGFDRVTVIWRVEGYISFLIHVGEKTVEADYKAETEFPNRAVGSRNEDAYSSSLSFPSVVSSFLSVSRPLPFVVDFPSLSGV